MTVYEAYKQCLKTGNPHIQLVSCDQVLNCELVEPFCMGQVWIPSLKTTLPIQLFYDKWEVTPDQQEPQLDETGEGEKE